MIGLGGLGQKNDLIFEDIEKAWTNTEGLHFSIRRCDGKPSRLEGGDQRRMIDQDPEASVGPGGDDRSNRAVEKDPVGSDHGEMKCSFSHNFKGPGAGGQGPVYLLKHFVMHKAVCPMISYSL